MLYAPCNSLVIGEDMFDAKLLGRRVAVTALAVVALASPMMLAGCDSSSSNGGSASAEDAQQVEQVQSDYAVTIDGSTASTDYEGNPVIIVDFTFTNNSDEDTSFAAACYPQAFQNGVQLENAIVTEDLGNGYMAELKPGASTSARIAYSLTDQSDVTVEVSELVSLDDALLAEATFQVA